MLGIGLENLVNRRLGHVALAQTELGLRQLDLQIIRPLGFEFESGLIFLDRPGVLLAGGTGIGQE